MSDAESKEDEKYNEDAEEDDDDYPPIIMDLGGSSVKSGFASLRETEPVSVCDTVVGHSKQTQIEYSDIYFGEKAINKEKGKLSLGRPIKHGVISHWDDFQLLVKYILSSELKLSDDDIEYSTLVLSETPLNPRVERERAIQLMFETFNCSSYYTQNNAVFELYSHGQTTGMTVGVGFDTCYTVPIYQGYALSHATTKMNIGGETVDKKLSRLLGAKGANLDSTGMEITQETLEEIKKTKCYVATDYQAEMKNRETAIWKNQNVIKYTLPDGHVITLSSERFECPEIFFQPAFIGGSLSKHRSIAFYAYESLLAVNIDIRKDFAANVCLVGGSSLLNGFTERFSKELKSTVPYSMSTKIGIHAKSRREFAGYTGMSIFSSLSLFKDLTISSEEYEEIGPKIVNRKCF